MLSDKVVHYMRTTTTEREHAAMEAAGMTDDELAVTVKDPATSLALTKAAADEQEYRAQARFQTGLASR